MAEGSRRKRLWGWGLAVLAVAALVLAGVLTAGHGHKDRPAARSPSLPPGQSAGGGGSTGTPPKKPAAPGGGGPVPTGGVPDRKAGPRTAAGSMASPPSTRTVPVMCHSDLPLSRSPDAPYSFLCTQAGRPLTWQNGNINLYVGRLSTVQNLARPAALKQWEAEGNFTVTQVSSPAAANVTINAAPLSNREDGYTQVHYSCTSRGCFYDHATVTLSSTATLLQTFWVSTICHELGHAAGLNHVSRQPQVMFPHINDTSPDAYMRGDIEGLQAESRQRPSTSNASRAEVTFGAWVAIS
jgi:Matrixin